MIKALRISFGCIYILPFYLLIRIFSLLIGKERAIKLWGPIVNSVITGVVEKILIPRINHPGDFDQFCSKMKKNLALFKPLLDTQIHYQDEYKIELRYYNCPHCEAFKLFGLPEVGPFICHGDWEIAERNSEVWDFNRTVQIGTGDEFCNHTYLRKKEN